MLKVNHMVLYPKASLSGLALEPLTPLGTWDWVSFLTVPPGPGARPGTEQVLSKAALKEDGESAAAAAHSPASPLPGPHGLVVTESHKCGLEPWLCHVLCGLSQIS